MYKSGNHNNHINYMYIYTYIYNIIQRNVADHDLLDAKVDFEEMLLFNRSARCKRRKSFRISLNKCLK